MYNSGSGPTNIVRPTYTFLPSSSPLSARIAAEVQGEGVPAPTQG